MKKILTILAVMFAVFTLNAQITADFTWSDPQCSGGTITFTDASTGDPATDWSWRINDIEELVGSGTFVYTFPVVTTPTDFDVSLYVTTADFSSDNITKTITIYPLPNVSIPTVDPVCEGTTVSVTEDGGEATSWAWSTGETTQTINPLMLNTTTFTVTGTENVHNCSNTASTTVVVNLIDTVIVEDGFCENSTYDFHGTVLDAPGTYFYTTTSNITGCDSVVELHLTQNPTYFIQETAEICNGETYAWEGNTYTDAGTYTVSYNSINSCDSIRELTLTVNPTYEYTETASICDNETYTWAVNGQTYDTPGIYTANLTTVNGCDSIIHLDLSVNPTYHFVTNEEICQGDSLQWRGLWFKNSGTYDNAYLSHTGCDSIYTLNLTVNPLPVEVVVIPAPSNGILTGGEQGQISLSTSFVNTDYWVTLGTAIYTNPVAGTGSSLNLAYNYIAGTYEVWSKNQYDCTLKQGNVTFTDDNGTTKIVASATYGDYQLSFSDNTVEMSLYKSATDVNNNPVIVLAQGPVLLSNGNIEFDNLDAGEYYVKSEITNENMYPNVIPVYFYDGATVDDADIVNVNNGDIININVNHAEYIETSGSNTAGGTVNGTEKSGLSNQVIIMRNQNTGDILYTTSTDANGEYYIDNVPDNSDIQLYVTSFEYQNWTPANITTTTNQHYTVNFTAQDGSVFPSGSGINSLSENVFDFAIYPNPAKDKIYFGNLPENSVIKIFDTTGKLLIYDMRNKRNELDISSLKSGIYIITAQSKDKKFGFKKLVVE